ncbi:Protein MAIN-LIKE 2, partial [Linum perenne]
QTPCKELVTALLERWRPETNTFHLLQSEATITLEDVEVLTGLPTRGRPVSVGYDARAADVICQELLGATPPPTRFTGHQVKILWVKEQFDRLPAGASAEVITYYARAYTWVLVGAVLLADRSGDLIPIHLLRLLSEFGDAGTFSWGSAVLAWLYKAMGRAAFFTGASQKGTSDIRGFTLLVQLWALERFPYIADRYIAGGDPPIADSYPRGMRWMPIVHRPRAVSRDQTYPPYDGYPIPQRGPGGSSSDVVDFGGMSHSDVGFAPPPYYYFDEAWADPHTYSFDDPPYQPTAPQY